MNTFTPFSLPFDIKSLSPALEKESVEANVELHKNYTQTLNELCEMQKIDSTNGIEPLIENLDSESTPSLIHSAGGYYNNKLFWENLMPEGTNISERFKKVILYEAGSRENLNESLIDLGMSVIGSGWMWLVVRENGEIMGMKTENNISPNMHVVVEQEEHRYIPILAINMWEHAYFIDYKHDKKSYLENIIPLINWDVVEDRYFKALDKLDLECPYDLT